MQSPGFSCATFECVGMKRSEEEHRTLALISLADMTFSLKIYRTPVIAQSNLSKIIRVGLDGV